MQEMERIELDFELITPSARIATATHGGRAKCLQRLLRLELPVPKTVAISFSGVHSIAAGHYEDIKDILNELEDIYNKINSEEMTIDDIEKFYKQSLILKKKSQDFCKQKNLKIDIV